MSGRLLRLGDFCLTRPVFTREHVDGSHKGKDDVQDPGNPNEGLRECPSKSDVSPAKYESDDQDEREEDDGVGVEAEAVGVVIDALTVETFESVVAIERDSRNRDKTKEEYDELQQCISRCLRPFSILVQRRGLPGRRPTDHSTWACRA